MHFDFLSLWELTLRSDLSDEELKLLLPNKRGNLEYSFDNFSLANPGKSLIMLMGAPGCGKTTMAETLKKRFHNEGLTCKIIHMDNLIHDYHLENECMVDFSTDFESLHMNCLQEKFNSAVDEHDVIILDGTFLSMSDRFVVLKPISEFFSNIIGIFLDTNIDILRQVQSERFFKKLSEEEFQDFQDQVKLILQEKHCLPVGFDIVYIIQR